MPNSKVTDLVTESANIWRHAGNDTDLIDVVVVGGEGKLAGLGVLLVVEVVAVVVHHHQVHSLTVLLLDVVLAGHKDAFGDLFFQTLSAVPGFQVCSLTQFYSVDFS